MGGSLGDEQSTQAEVSKPPGIRYIEHTRGSTLGFRSQQAIVLVLTFLAYACYHATRKTASIVKGALDSSAPNLGSPLWRLPLLPRSPHGAPDDGWAPFDGPDGRKLLGEIDLAFLSAYSVGIYFAGHLGDRLDLRTFLAAGMAGTGIFTSLFGAGYWLGIHSFYYYLAVQVRARRAAAVNGVAVGGGGGGEMVWEGQARAGHGRLERAHLGGQHHGVPTCGGPAEAWVGVVLPGARPPHHRHGGGSARVPAC